MKKTYILLQFIILLLLVDNVKAQLKLGDQPTSVQKSVILDLQGSNGRQGVWLPRISDTTDATGIDGLNPPDGVLIYHTPSSQVMIRKNGFWSSLQTTTKVGSTTSTNNIIEFQLGTVAGAGKDLNYSLNSSTGVVTLNVPDAAVDTRGVVTIGSQTFGGVKTFNNGLTSLSTTTISGASSNASNLYLGINSSTTPGTTTDRFLTVDNSGRVVLAQGTPSNTTITINGTTYDLTANRTWNVGTVTSVAGGYGINGGTITTTGTLSIDTSAMATRAWRQKGIDSLASLINGYVPSTRTLNGLSLSSNQTFAVGTSGTDFNIVSSGTTHTFNIPTASSTTRGLLSSADWTTFNNKGTVSSVGAGYGINGGTITTTGTHSVDTTIISTRSWRQKGIDSVAGLLNSYIPSTRTITINGTAYDLSANRSWSVGTVTSVGAGYGINGGTITSTGTHSVDTTIISTRAWRQKGIDSVVSLINGYVPSTRTLNGLSLSSNQTFAVGTSGTDFNIVSSGTTHTFNIPTASSTTRGLLSSADWTTFNNKGTVSSVGAGYGINGGTITTTGTHSVDTTIISTRSWRQKGIDSVAGLLNSYIPSTRTITINGTAYDLSANRSWSVGTVTSIAAGYGINGGTITSTGTHSVDTTIISTRAWRQKGIDSVASLINGFIPATRTLNGLALSSNQTFAVGTSGTDFNIVSSGTTHTFNIPDASSSARGLVTTGTQTFAGSKTFNNTVTAKVLLQAGTATAGTAPLKFTSGTNLSTPENGAIEYDGTNYFATSGGIRYTIAKTLTATATLDFPSTDGAGGSSSLNVTVTGAAVGDVVSIGIPPSAMVSGGTYNAYVSAANTVTIVFTNSLVAFFGIGITADPGSGTFRVSVTKY